jgi:membrane-associated phospholipid phosphatase
MNSKQLAYTGLLAALLCLIAIGVLDRPVAKFVHQHGEGTAIFSQGTTWIETVFGWGISKLALSYALLASGAILWWRQSWRATANLFLFIALTHIVRRLVAGTLKNVFERLRPDEVIQQAAWNAQFFTADGNSFPSGHAAHFWSLYFPLAFIFPRYRIPLAIVPAFITIARVGVNDHFVSDVIASIVLAVMISLAFVYAFKLDDGVAQQTAKLISFSNSEEKA